MNENPQLVLVLEDLTKRIRKTEFSILHYTVACLCGTPFLYHSG